MPQRVYLSHYSWASPPHKRDSDVYCAELICDGQSISHPGFKVNLLDQHGVTERIKTVFFLLGNFVSLED